MGKKACLHFTKKSLDLLYKHLFLCCFICGLRVLNKPFKLLIYIAYFNFCLFPCFGFLVFFCFIATVWGFSVFGPPYLCSLLSTKRPFSSEQGPGSTWNKPSVLYAWCAVLLASSFPLVLGPWAD